MDQWNIESLKDRARKFTEEARNLSSDLQYALRRKEKEEKNGIAEKACVVLAVISGILLFCGLLYLVYRFLAPKYMDEYDDFDDEEEFENEE